jgi:hypothetical protein
VERRHPHLLGHGADERLNARLHLVGRLVGEGDGQDLEGRDPLFLDEPRDAVRQHARLARPGTGHDQERTAGVGHRLPLDRVEVFEQSSPAGAAISGATLPAAYDVNLVL